MGEMAESLGALIRDARRAYVPDLPRVLFWAIINHCNAVCTSCSFYLVPRVSKTHVRVEEAKKAVDVLWEGGFRFTSITGGEPLMNPDVFDICDAIARRGIVITYIPTNGILMDDAAARRLRDADVRVVGISVEPIREDGMGATRKIPKFREVIIRARGALERAGVPNYAGILLSKATRDIPKVLASVAELGFDKVVFSYPQLEQGSSYLASRHIPEIDLTAEEVERMVHGIKAAKRDFPEIGIYNTNESLDDFLRFYRGEPRRYGCWGGRRLFYLDWNLDLYQCFTLPKRYGNILDMDRIDVEEPGLCDLCTQQAFRDFGPFYAAAQGIADARDLALSGHPIQAVRSLVDPQAVDGFRALLEVHKAGFV